jgi:hypothetical protein
VLALAFVHQGVQLRKGQREIDQMREQEQQALQAQWQLAGHSRRLEVERQQLARQRQEHEQRQHKAGQPKAASREGNPLLARLLDELRPRKPLAQEPGPKQKDQHGTELSTSLSSATPTAPDGRAAQPSQVREKG